MSMSRTWRNALLALAILVAGGGWSRSADAPPPCPRSVEASIAGDRGTPASRPTTSASVAAGRGDFEIDVSNNIAGLILRLDAQVKPVTDAMRSKLEQALKDACAEVVKIERKRTGRWDRRYVEAVLKAIDGVLIHHGFVYPPEGAVDQLVDSLVALQLSEARRGSYEQLPHNQRRRNAMKERFPGPFYVLDCDTACFIYLGVADALRLPIHMVLVPSRNRRPGHAFVRWREGSRSLNWETMDGAVRPDEYYIKEWKIRTAAIDARSALADLTTTQVLGCAHYLLATQHERRKEHDRALAELATALELHPQNLDVRRQFAWLTATGIGVADRDDAAAIANALFVVRLADDADARDTLAAAYASAGAFDRAIEQQRAAIASGTGSVEAQLGFRQRLRLYQQHTAYRQAGAKAPVAGGSEP